MKSAFHNTDLHIKHCILHEIAIHTQPPRLYSPSSLRFVERFSTDDQSHLPHSIWRGSRGHEGAYNVHHGALGIIIFIVKQTGKRMIARAKMKCHKVSTYFDHIYILSAMPFSSLRLHKRDDRVRSCSLEIGHCFATALCMSITVC